MTKDFSPSAVIIIEFWSKYKIQIFKWKVEKAKSRKQNVSE